MMNIKHVYKTMRMDAKSEFAREGQNLGQMSMSAKKRNSSSVKQIYLFICKHNSFYTRFCMLIVISWKNIKKICFTTNCSSVDSKMGSNVIRCNNQGIFTKCVLFLCGPITK